ncbi:hypothetical protein [Alkalicoccus urumqiensis]|nr:hypothetical protein [Alkalicoccus urumqiensis]
MVQCIRAEAGKKNCCQVEIREKQEVEMDERRGKPDGETADDEPPSR